MFGYRDSTTPATGASMRLYNENGGPTTIKAINSATASMFTVVLGQWYVVKYSLDTANAAEGSSFTVWSNGALIGSDTFTRAAATDIRYIFIGADSALEAGDECTIWYDLLCIKTN